MGKIGNSGRVTRRFMLGALLGGVAGTAFANAPLSSMRPVARAAGIGRPAVPTAPAADALVAAAKLTGKTGFVVADAASGEVLESRNPLLAQPPASVTKAITALYALDKLGSGYRFSTQLIATGPVSNGVLKGDLILAGGGDPTLDTDALGEMAQQLKAKGVAAISGKFLVYAGALPQIDSIDPGQPVHVGYNPSISGLNLNYNRVHFEWKKQGADYALTMDARARKYSPTVSIAQMRVANRSLPVYTYNDKGGADQWTVARSALGNAGSRWLPVRKPALYAGEVFQALARAHGVALPRAGVAKNAPRGSILVERHSGPLREILRDMMKYSTNLTAEIVGLTASAAGGGGPHSLSASAAKMTAWAQGALGAKKAKFVDHSGLGGNSKLSAADMVKALVRVQGSGVLKSIMKEIPMRDAKGKIIANHPIKVRAKTGTLNFASCLAGYMTAPDGRELAFAIFSADVPRRNAIKASDGDIPEGSQGWKSRARRLQLRLIERWGTAYSS